MKISNKEKHKSNKELSDILNDIYSKCIELKSFGFPKHKMIFGGKYTKWFAYYDNETNEIIVNYFSWINFTIFIKRLVVIHELIHFIGMNHNSKYCYEKNIFDYFSFKFYLRIFDKDKYINEIDKKIEKKIEVLLTCGKKFDQKK